MKFSQFLGLGISIIFYLILIILILLYLILTIYKKEYASKKILNITLYHSIISIVAISYGLVLLNDGYNLILIDLDYSIMLIFLSLMFILIAFSTYYHNTFNLTYKLLPYAIFIIFSFDSIIFYFLCHYYNFICKIWLRKRFLEKLLMKYLNFNEIIVKYLIYFRK